MDLPNSRETSAIVNSVGTTGRRLLRLIFSDATAVLAVATGWAYALAFAYLFAINRALGIPDAFLSMEIGAFFVAIQLVVFAGVIYLALHALSEATWVADKMREKTFWSLALAVAMIAVREAGLFRSSPAVEPIVIAIALLLSAFVAAHLAWEVLTRNRSSKLLIVGLLLISSWYIASWLGRARATTWQPYMILSANGEDLAVLKIRPEAILAARFDRVQKKIRPELVMVPLRGERAKEIYIESVGPLQRAAVYKPGERPAVAPSATADVAAPDSPRPRGSKLAAGE